MDPYEKFAEFDGSKQFIDFLVDVNECIKVYDLGGVDTLTILSDGMPLDTDRVKARLRQGLAELNKPDADPFEAPRAFKLALKEVDGYPKKKTCKQTEAE